MLTNSKLVGEFVTIVVLRVKRPEWADHGEIGLLFEGAANGLKNLLLPKIHQFPDDLHNLKLSNRPIATRNTAHLSQRMHHFNKLNCQELSSTNN